MSHKHNKQQYNTTLCNHLEIFMWRFIKNHAFSWSSSFNCFLNFDFFRIIQNFTIIRFTLIYFGLCNKKSSLHLLNINNYIRSEHPGWVIDKILWTYLWTSFVYLP